MHDSKVSMLAGENNMKANKLFEKENISLKQHAFITKLQ